MCEAKVYVRTEGADREVMRDVARIDYDAETGTLVLRSLLGERKMVRGRVTQLDFLEHTVVIATQEAETGGVQET